jgi:hypothetical protein
MEKCVLSTPLLHQVINKIILKNAIILTNILLEKKKKKKKKS